jgi:hypothetical protein
LFTWDLRRFTNSGLATKEAIPYFQIIPENPQPPVEPVE